MINGKVELLDLEGLLLGNDDAYVRKGLALAPVPAGEGDGPYPLGLGDHQSIDDIPGISGGGDTQEDVAFVTEGVDELGEGLPPSDIVGECGIGGVHGRERDRGKASLEVRADCFSLLSVQLCQTLGKFAVDGTFEHEGFGEFPGDVVAVRGASAVACDEQFTLVPVGLQEKFVSRIDILPAGFETGVSLEKLAEYGLG